MIIFEDIHLRYILQGEYLDRFAIAFPQIGKVYPVICTIHNTSALTYKDKV